MKEKLDFSEVPYQYSMCLNRQCPKADTCLRQLAEQSVPEKVEHWTIISPKRLTTVKGDCPYYRSNIKARYAKGFIGILESLPHKQMESVITHLISFFSRRTYYRVRKGEHTASIAQGGEWITEQSVSQPQLGDDGLTTVTLTYNLSGATNARGGIVRITNTNNTIISDIAVVQKDPDVELVNIPDQNLRTLVVKNNWAFSIAGSQCIILEAGLNATSLSNSSYSSQLTDLTGIENFPNLTSLSLGYCTNMKKLVFQGYIK